MLRWVWVVLFSVLLSGTWAQYYEVPEATVLPLKPKGLHISIPDEPGVQLFAIHVNVNKPIANREAGQINQETRKSKDGRWVIEDPRVRLKPGDTLNYWLYVQVDDLGYPKDDITFKVTELVDPSQSIPSSPPTGGPDPPNVCGGTLTTVNGRPACQGNLVFEETFDTLNLNKWQHVVQFAANPDYEFVVYTGKEKNCYVSNGRLHVQPTLLIDSGTDVKTGILQLSGCTSSLSSTDCTRTAQGWFILPPIQSAQISTKQAFSFRYGRIEVQAKVPAGDWIFPEIWLEPKTNTYGSNGYESGRIQLALVRGNQNLLVNGEDIGGRYLDASCIMGYNKIVHGELFSKYNSGFWSDSLHTFGVTWTPDGITFSVDGQDIGKVIPPPGGFSTLSQFSQLQNIPWSRGSNIAPFDQEFFISIGLGAGGFRVFPDNSFSNNEAKPWKNRDPKAMLNFWNDKDKWLPTWSGDASILQVEHVKVWAL